MRDETVSIAVDSPLWATQLRYLEADIVERANALVGTAVVQAIQVRVEPVRHEFRHVWHRFRGGQLVS